MSRRQRSNAWSSKDARSAAWCSGTEEYRRQALARAEVLLAAGSINSPKILELSGIGQPERLAGLGIEVVHASPGVGENLQDHLQIRTVFKVRNATTLNTLANSFWGKLRIGLEYALRRSGPMSMAPSQFGMFTKSDPARATPDLEYHVQPLSTDRLGDLLHPFPAITVSVCNLRPESRGSCHVTSTDLDRQPEIRPNYLSTDNDRRVAVVSVRQAREIMTARALRRYEPEEFLPGVDVQSDEDLVEEVGNIATTIFHPVGTCKMGQDSRCGSRCRPSRARAEPAANRGRLDHAADRVRKYRFPGRDDRREGRRHGSAGARELIGERPLCLIMIRSSSTSLIWPRQSLISGCCTCRPWTRSGSTRLRF